MTASTGKLVDRDILTPRKNIVRLWCLNHKALGHRNRVDIADSELQARPADAAVANLHLHVDGRSSRSVGEYIDISVYASRRDIVLRRTAAS